jgi:hypothetical protein
VSEIISRVKRKVSIGGHTDGLQPSEVLGYHNEQGDHSCRFIISP